MKRLFTLVMTIFVAVSLVGCGGTTSQEQNSNTQSQDEPPEPLTEAEVKMMYSNPEEYIGSTVELVGIVFAGVEYDEDAIYFQMWGDPENLDLNTVVTYPDPTFKLEDDQYVKVVGEVVDVFEGENMMGGTITAPAIRASSLEVLSYQDAMAPTISTATAATQTIEQYGYSVTVQKAELAESETRLYISVTNNGSNEFNLYTFNMKIIQNGTQYEEEMNYNADYPEIQSGILPGVTTEGIVTFPALEQAPFQVIIEGSSGDWHEDLKDYVFDLAFQ